MIKYVKDLKKQGYRVVAATNQDYKQYQAYRAKMKKNHGIDYFFQNKKNMFTHLFL